MKYLKSKKKEKQQKKKNYNRLHCLALSRETLPSWFFIFRSSLVVHVILFYWVTLQVISLNSMIG